MGIFSKNREEWAIIDIACMKACVTIVPFYESLGLNAVNFVINQTELTTICIEKKNFDSLIKMKNSCSISL